MPSEGQSPTFGLAPRRVFEETRSQTETVTNHFLFFFPFCCCPETSMKTVSWQACSCLKRDTLLWPLYGHDRGAEVTPGRRGTCTRKRRAPSSAVPGEGVISSLQASVSPSAQKARALNDASNSLNSTIRYIYTHKRNCPKSKAGTVPGLQTYTYIKYNVSKYITYTMYYFMYYLLYIK